MKAVVEPLEGNKVKLSVEVDEAEFEKAIDAAFRKIAHEARIPGFRPGKAPRRLLEARIGTEAARQEALRDSLPEFYVRALKEHDVDAIAPPDIDITAGEESGGVSFDAVVEVRPTVDIIGYEGLEVTIPAIEVSDDEVAAQIDRLRAQSGELAPVSRPAQAGDFVSIDIKGEHQGEEVPQLTADDYLYEVGSGSVVPELDEHLTGAKVGDILAFDAEIADSEPVQLRVLVKDVKERVLPEVTDEWASEASEFDTVEELRADIANRLAMVKKVQGRLALNDAALQSLVELVSDEPPEALVSAEVERRLHDLAHRLEHQGASVEQYLAATGQSGDELIASMRGGAVQAVKADLGLRALADKVEAEANDEDITAYIERLAKQAQQKPDKVRAQLDRSDQMPAVLSDIRKSKALQWLVDHVSIVDEEGRPIERAALEPVLEGSSDTGAGEDDV